MKFHKKIFATSLFLLICLHSFAQNQWQVTSPNANLRATINLDGSGFLSYNVHYINNNIADPVINASPLGIERGDETFLSGLVFENTTTQVIDENYSMISGKQTSLRNYANEIKIGFVRNTKKLVIIFRAYNDGIAFRYYFPENSATNYTVRSEYTKVNFASTNGKAWLQTYNNVPYYEDRFHEYNIGQDSPVDAGWSFPALFNPPNCWVLFTESDVNRNSYVSHFNRYAGGGGYKIDNPIQNDFKPAITNTATSTLPWALPWRVLIIGKTPNTIIESSLVNHLASPTTMTNTSWIKPGVATWSWWSDLGSPTKYLRQREYVELANTLGLHNVVVDGTWEQMGETNFRNLINYGNTLGVKVWNWYDAGGLCEQLNQSPCDLMRDRTKRRTEFAKIKAWGVVGVKVDFFISDKQEFIKLYFDVLQDAAEFELMVLMHGCTIPQGWQRAFPHLVSSEAVEGGEMLLFREDFRYASPAHNVDLVFTRNVIGSVDYTPGVLSIDRVFHNTTSAHELALLSVLETGFTTLADRASSYLALPAIAQNIIGNMPVSWDETKFIEGTPEDYAVMARRKGNNWYVSGINGKNNVRNLSINPNFLSAGSYEKQALLDGADARQITVSQVTYQSGNVIPITMLPYGGFTLVFKAKCLDNLRLVNAINSSVVPYRAVKIEAVNQLISGANVIYSAKKSVLLNVGFLAQKGSIFKAEIGGCLE